MLLIAFDFSLCVIEKMSRVKQSFNEFHQYVSSLAVIFHLVFTLNLLYAWLSILKNHIFSEIKLSNIFFKIKGK